MSHIIHPDPKTPESSNVDDTPTILNPDLCADVEERNPTSALITTPNPDSSVTSERPWGFHKLPFEIQDLIFDMAAPGPRIIDLRGSSSKGPICDDVPLLRVCRRSRARALLHYTPFFTRWKCPVFIDHSQDILSFQDTYYDITVGDIYRYPSELPGHRKQDPWERLQRVALFQYRRRCSSYWMNWVVTQMQAVREVILVVVEDDLNEVKESWRRPEEGGRDLSGFWASSSGNSKRSEAMKERLKTFRIVCTTEKEFFANFGSAPLLLINPEDT